MNIEGNRLRGDMGLGVRQQAGTVVEHWLLSPEEVAEAIRRGAVPVVWELVPGTFSYTQRRVADVLDDLL